MLVVIKNVPPSLTEEDITQDLDQYKLPIIKLARLLNKDKTPMLVCTVDLSATEDANQIFKINSICNAMVKVEMRRATKGTPQCHRCQRYGHTKNYCSLTPRCIRCKRNHLSGQCSKPKLATPECINCGEEHPANYKGCKYYLETVQQQNQHRRVRQLTAATTNPTSDQMQNNATGERTYSQVTQNCLTRTPPENPNKVEQTSTFLETILTTLINLIKPYIHQIKNILIANIIPILTNAF